LYSTFSTYYDTYCCGALKAKQLPIPNTNPTMPTGASKIIEKITARVFCSQGGSGGNPVTIFTSPVPLSKGTRIDLARTCDWESVVVDVSERRLSFYMPNGDPVPFCAHAAMGGASVLGDRSRDGTVTFSVDRVSEGVNGVAMDPKYTALLHSPGDVVSLDVSDLFLFEKVAHPPALQRILRDCFGLSGSDLIEPPTYGRPRHPTFGNATVFGRPKTLVFVNSLERLQTVRVPPVGPTFVASCDALASTGIYLYCPVENGRFECRQFPRSSGYPEDPATGVAAAALACSLSQSGIRSKEEDEDLYRFMQGTAMGRPSLLVVERIVLGEDGESDSTDERSKPVSFRLMGHMQVDQREKIRVDD
jgi:trans-2,3-dihydro-3-hydroxyanthranilate isomerase